MRAMLPGVGAASEIGLDRPSAMGLDPTSEDSWMNPNDMDLDAEALDETSNFLVDKGMPEESEQLSEDPELMQATSEMALGEVGLSRTEQLTEENIAEELAGDPAAEGTLR